MSEKDDEVKLRCGFVCSNCKSCVLRHYAMTTGRCSNCHAQLSEDDAYLDGAGI